MIEFAKTERQREVLRAVEQHGSQRKAAKALGMAQSTLHHHLDAVRKNAALRGHSPAHDMTHTVPEGFGVKGVSTMYGPEGEIRAQWVKSHQQDVTLMIEAACAAARSDIKPERAVKPPKTTQDGLLNLYVITDYHIGMKADEDETGGEDWDVQIAEDTLVKWFADAISRSPDAEVAILGQLGDFLHYDSLTAVTPASGHVLDSDTRYQKMVRVAIRAIRRVVSMLLAKHQRVHILMAEGNHDEAGSAWLREMFDALYAEEPRVSVDTSLDPYYAYQHGKTALFFHHGHKRKPQNIDTVFAAKFRQMFGSTTQAYAHMGHYHHDRLIETNLMTVEQHRTLASPDAYAVRGGWMSGRSANVITYCDERGEVSRISVSPSAL